MMNARAELEDRITALVKDLHPERVRKLAAILRRFDKESDSKIYEISDFESNKEMSDLIDCWKMSDVTPLELASMLSVAAHAYHSARAEWTAQLAWTGPKTPWVATRRTEQVLLEIIRAASERLFMMSFIVYKADSITQALFDAIQSGVDVSILIDSGKKHDDSSIHILKNSLPGAKIYTWENKDETFSGGRVHAKLVVADARFCFLSSANLTEYALERNMEAGVLIQGGEVPDRLHRHLDALVSMGVIKLN